MQVAPQIEILSRMACQVHRPDLAVELSAPNFVAANTFSVLGDYPRLLPGFYSTYRAHTESPDGGKPSNDEICRKDATVRRAVASILAVLVSTGGMLTMCTTGWWGQRSDMWGRTRVLAVAVVAMAAGEVNLILVAKYGHLLPGVRYWWLLPGSVILGLLGGGSGNAPMQAYLSDAADPDDRASVFSVWGGVTWAGTAIGPLIAGELLKATHNLLSVYYFSVAVNIFLFVMWVFVVPESLEPSTRAENKKRWREARRIPVSEGAGFVSRVFRLLTQRLIVDLIEPLSICLPRLRDPNNPRKGKDWNLTFTALSYLCLVIVTGGTIYLVQLVHDEFGLDSIRIGYWVSALGIVRAVYLLFFLPGVYALLRPKSQPVELPGPEEQLHREASLHVPAVSEAGAGDEPEMETPPWFDLVVARVSIICDTLTFLAMLAASTVQQFIVFSMGMAFGAGLAPAYMSLALALSPGGAAEGGKLFGAFGILTSLGAEVLSQWIIGGIYAATTTFFPRAILLAIILFLGLGLFFTFFVRLPPAPNRR
ncbi:MFS general substrate transporter [Auricularia subglabra TFB-10046 SS5]|nr:MFS general substrate transporter [Auricularia subglabra TFB-10046 SS5]